MGKVTEYCFYLHGKRSFDMVLICLDKLRLNTAVILSLENVCWSKILKTADKVWWDPLNENSKQNTTKTRNETQRKFKTKYNENSK